MARRVNTKFVIMMSVSLGAVAAGLVGIKGVQMWRVRDPELMKAQGEAAEKAGNLKFAIDRYGRAAALLAGKHVSGADVYYKKAGDLSEKIAETTDSPEEAVTCNQNATMYWQMALRENPHNKELNEKLLDDQVINVEYSSGDQRAPQYKRLQELAEAMVKLEDSAKAETYVAQAKYENLLLSVNNNTKESDFDDVMKNLNAALQLDPKYGPAVALDAQKKLLQARIRLALNNVNFREPLKDDAPDDVKKPWQDEVDAYQKSLDEIAQNLNGYIEQNGVQPDVAEAIADLTQVQLSDMMMRGAAAQAQLEDLQKRAAELQKQDSTTRPAGQPAGKVNGQQKEIADLLERAAARKKDIDALIAKATEQHNSVMALLEKAYAADPTNSSMTHLLLNQYARNDPDKGVAMLKAMIERDPEKPAGYWQYADFLRIQGRTEEAIEQYRQVRKHSQIGTGIEVSLNRSMQLQSLERLAWLTLDMATKEGPTTEKGQAWMKESVEFTDKLRAANWYPGVLYLLDGRAQLLSRDVPTAMVTLHKAEVELNRPDLQSRFRQTELLLAQANAMEKQPGLALELLDKALSIPPADNLESRQRVGLYVQRGRLLLDVGRIDEARAMLTAILGEKDEKTGKYKNADQLGEKGTAEITSLLLRAAVASGGQPDKTNLSAGTSLQVAQVELNNSDNENAAIDAARVLAAADVTDPQAAEAYRIEVIATARQEKKDEAKKLAAEALAKFPKNTMFQRFNAELSQSGDISTPEAQKAIIEAVTDEHDRQILLGGYYLQQKKYDEAIAALQKAEQALGSTPDRDLQKDDIDRQFDASLSAAVSQPAGPKRDAYFAIAQTCVTKAEKLNLDGTGGKLYEGHLQMVKTDNKEGLKDLEQAVAQRPDYVVGRMFLGQAYYDMKNYSAALDEFRHAAQLAPNNLAALQATIVLLINKGDSASITEASGFLKTALNLSPYNSRFVAFKDLLASNVDDAIKTREQIVARDPKNLNNIRGLAALYVKKANQEPIEKGRVSRQKAVELIQGEIAKYPNNLDLSDSLAHLYLDLNKGDQSKATEHAGDIANGLKKYDPFLADPDQATQFKALVLKSLFQRDAGDSEGAVKSLQQAIKIEPAGSDQGERYLADMYFEHSQWPEAEALYTKIMASATDPGGKDLVVRRLIETLLWENVPEKRAVAAPLLADLLKRFPDDKQGLILQAFANIREGNIPPAMTALGKVLAVDEGNTAALFFRANANIEQGHFDDAIRDLETARNHDPRATNLNVRTMLATLYQQTKHYGEASLEFADAIALHPEMLDLRIKYSRFLLELAQKENKLPVGSDDEDAVTIRNLNPKDKLYEQIKDGSEKFPASRPQWYYLYGQLLELRKSPELARNMYKMLVDSPEGKRDAGAQEAYIGTMLTMGDYAQAIKTASEFLDSNGDFIAANPEYVTLYLKRAKAFYAMQGKEAEGMQDINRALSVAAAWVKKGNDPSIYLLILRDATDPDAAAPLKNATMIEALKGRVAADPSDVVAKLALGQMLALDKQMAEGLKLIMEVPVPEAKSRIRTMALRERALFESENGKYDDAEKEYKVLLAENPYDIESLNNYAFLLAENKHDPVQAIALAQRALDALATRSNITQVLAQKAGVEDTLGWAQYLKGDNTAAGNTLRETLKLQAIPSAYYHLAMVYLKDPNKDNSTAFAQLTVDDGIKFAEVQHDAILPELQKLQEKIGKPPNKTK